MALRLLRRLLGARGFGVSAIAVTALGVGAATTIFSVIDAVLLARISPLEDRVVVAYRADVSPDTPRGPISLLDLADWRAATTSFEALGAFGMFWGISAAGEGTALPEVRHVAVTPHFFEAVGVQPMLGRGFLPEEAEAGADHAVVISHRFWQRALGGEPEALGDTLELDVGIPYTIVGIMPRGFSFPNQVDLWSPARMEPPVDQRTWAYVFAVGKLAPGATVEEARAELELIDARVWDETRPRPRDHRIETATLSELALSDAMHSTLSALAAAVALLVLVTAVNLLGLCLVRTLSRRREVAIRSALGATGLARVSATLSELGLVCGVGGLGGAWLAHTGLELLIAFGPKNVPRLELAAFDGEAGAFALAVTLALYAVVAVVSASVASGWSVGPGLAVSAPGSPGMLRLGRGFAVVQMAATVYLVLGAALLTGSLLRLSEEDLGYDPDGVLAFVVAREETLNANVNSQAWIRTASTLLARLEAIPGVRAAAAVAWPPMSGVGWQMWFVTEDQGSGLVRQEREGPRGERIVRYAPPAEAIEQNDAVTYQTISSDYFRAMGISLLEGRAFDDRSDTESSSRVVIVNQSFAEAQWPGESAVGKRMLTYGFRYDDEGRAMWQTVIGVVEDARYAAVDTTAPAIYAPWRQSGIFFPRSIVLATSGEPFAVAGSARAALRAIEPTARMERIRTLDAVVADALVPWQFNAGLVGVFAATSLALAMTGLFSTLAQFVGQRTRELGIRLALGATGASLRALILGMGARIVFWGVAIGLALGVGTSRFLEAHLYEMTPTDPIAYAAAASVAALAALVACYAPAARAARTHPSVALRQE